VRWSMEKSSPVDPAIDRSRDFDSVTGKGG
jgi:hypothetical protein